MLTKLPFLAFFILSLLLMAGCGTGGAGTPNAPEEPPPQAAAATARPAPEAATASVSTPIPLPPEGTIDTSGTVIVAPAAPTGQPGSVEGSGGGESGAPGDERPAPQPSAWLTYTDPRLGFSITYPDIYVILDEPAQAPMPGMVGRVRFLDQQLAAGDTAELEPPQFAVEVFENPGGLTIEQWMDANAPGGDRQPITVGGAPGYRLTLQTLLAPGEFFYVQRGSYVYRLTPLGEHAAEMLRSFQFKP